MNPDIAATLACALCPCCHTYAQWKQEPSTPEALWTFCECGPIALDRKFLRNTDPLKLAAVLMYLTAMRAGKRRPPRVVN